MQDDLAAQISKLPGRQTAAQIVARLERDIEAARRRGVTWADLARTIGGVTPQALAQAWSRHHRRQTGTNHEGL